VVIAARHRYETRAGAPVTSVQEKGLSKLAILSELTRAPHGDLDEYLPVGTRAAMEDVDFYAHLIAWNEKNGQVRDAKLALPVIQLSTLKGVPQVKGGSLGVVRENAQAHLALLSPRDLVRALRWAKGKVAHRHLAEVVKRYLRARERNQEWWDRTVLAHRKSMYTLYRYMHVSPSKHANEILFEGYRPEGSLFEVLGNLRTMRAQDAAAAIVNHRLPMLSVVGALGGKVDEEIGFALIEVMTPTQLVTNTAMLERAGMSANPAMRAAYDAKLTKVATSKSATLKTTRATTAGKGLSEKVKEKLKATQEKQLDAAGVKGNWVVLADKSGSMEAAIEAARHVTAMIARVCEGETHLVFFDTSARYVNATGRDYEWINAQTALVRAQGGTSIGVGLQALLERGVMEIDGVVVVSDAQENSTPFFAKVYADLCKKIDKEPPVYLYRLGAVSGTYSDLDLANTMKKAGYDLQEFDLRNRTIDYTSLPNLVLTMRANRHSLIDEVFATPLLTLDDVYAVTRAY
jgi:hypothetical protein